MQCTEEIRIQHREAKRQRCLRHSSTTCEASESKLSSLSGLDLTHPLAARNMIFPQVQRCPSQTHVYEPCLGSEYHLAENKQCV